MKNKKQKTRILDRPSSIFNIGAYSWVSEILTQTHLNWLAFLKRHAAGDWGDSPFAQRNNAVCQVIGQDVISTYPTEFGTLVIATIVGHSNDIFLLERNEGTPTNCSPFERTSHETFN